MAFAILDRLGVWRREQQQLLDEPNVMVPDAGSTQPLHEAFVGTLCLRARRRALLHSLAIDALGWHAPKVAPFVWRGAILTS